MLLSDFEKQPRGPYAFDFWIAKERIITPIGDFSVELQMGVGDTDPPDTEMLRRADELVALLRADYERIQDKVFEHYLRSTDDPDWLEECGMSVGLDRTDILEHLLVRSLTVLRNRDDEEVDYESSVYIIPVWDEEHAIYLVRQGEEWMFRDL